MSALIRLDASDVILNLISKSRFEVLAEIASKVAESNPDLISGELLRLLMERESLGSTGIGDGVAIPHCTSPALKEPVILFGRSHAGIDFKAVDGKPVFILFLIVTPEGNPAIHLKLLSRISRILKNSSLKTMLIDAISEDEIVEIIENQEIVRCLP